MVSLPVLVSELVRLALQPAIIGSFALVLVLVRELGPEWKGTVGRLAFDLLLVVLALTLVFLLGVKLAAAPT